MISDSISRREREREYLGRMLGPIDRGGLDWVIPILGYWDRNCEEKAIVKEESIAGELVYRTCC